MLAVHTKVYSEIASADCHFFENSDLRSVRCTDKGIEWSAVYGNIASLAGQCEMIATMQMSMPPKVAYGAVESQATALTPLSSTDMPVAKF